MLEIIVLSASLVVSGVDEEDFMVSTALPSANHQDTEAEEKTQDSDPPAPPAKASDEDTADTSRTLRAEDYGQFERLSGMTLSPDGRWIAFGLRKNDETVETRLRMLATENDEILEQASRAQFSRDSRFLACVVSPKPSKGEGPPQGKSKVHLKNLIDGGHIEFEGASNFAFSEDGKFLAMSRRSGDQQDLIIRRLHDETHVTFGHVSSFAWSDTGAWVAFVIETEDKIGNGVQLYDATHQTLKALDSANASYRNLTWREDAFDIAVLRSGERDPDEDAYYDVVAFLGVDSDDPQTRKLSGTKHAQFPRDRRVFHGQGLRWSDDGRALFFGVKEWIEKPQESRGGRGQGRRRIQRRGLL